MSTNSRKSLATTPCVRCGRPTLRGDVRCKRCGELAEGLVGFLENAGRQKGTHLIVTQAAQRWKLDACPFLSEGLVRVLKPPFSARPFDQYPGGEKKCPRCWGAMLERMRS